MATPTMTETATVVVHDPVGRGRFGRILVTLELSLGIAAIGGGIALVTSPRDAMPHELLDRTPFSTWVWPGLLLIATVAVPALVGAAAALLRRPFAHVGHPLVGVVLMGWIVVQLVVIGPTSWLQPVMATWGAAILALGAANYRRWHLGWGATAAEQLETLPGDELIGRPHFVPTRAVTINAPPAVVWPWIVQMGYGRAGWYSYDLLDNRGRRSADHIEPRWQRLKVGDAVPMSGRDDRSTAFRVHTLAMGQSMVWAKPDATWVWVLRSTPDGGTRLVTRVRARYTGWSALLGVPLMELGDFPMMRKCLRGIKNRAERTMPSAHT